MDESRIRNKMFLRIQTNPDTCEQGLILLTSRQRALKTSNSVCIVSGGERSYVFV